MIKYIINRLLLMLLVLLGVLAFIFALSRSPGAGDPCVAILGEGYSRDAYEALYQELGLDKPVLVQYFNYVKDVVTKFDLGTSYLTKRAVSEEVLERFPVSIKLTAFAILISVPFGVLFGMISAYKHNSPLDYGVSVVAMLGQALPNFWLAIMLMLIFGLKLKWLPATELNDWTGYILPAVTLASTPISVMMRMTRATMLEVISQDYIRTARSKGLNERQVLFGHALQNAAMPVVTQIGNQIVHTVGGASVVENIFLIPGLGSYMIYAITTNDYPAVQGSVFVFAMFVTLVNLCMDILYGFVDPRIKAKYTTTSRAAKKLSRAVMVGAR